MKIILPSFLEKIQNFECFSAKYSVESELCTSTYGVISQGKRTADNLPVVFKYVKFICKYYGETKIPLEAVIMWHVRNLEKCIKILDFFKFEEGCVIVMERLNRCNDLFYFKSKNLSIILGIFR